MGFALMEPIKLIVILFFILEPCTPTPAQAKRVALRKKHSA